jgi:hypothetical protein
MDLWPPVLGFLDHTYKHTVELLWTSDQPVAEASTYTRQHNRQTSIPRAGFEPATPATKRPQKCKVQILCRFNFQTSEYILQS